LKEKKAVKTKINGKLECVMIQSDKLLSCSNERRKSQFYCVMGV